MANGQQKAQQNLDAFEVWRVTQTDDDFKQIIFRGQLNRGEVAKAIGCGKSALNQNPALKEALLALEDKLRDKGVLPPLTESAKKDADKPKQYDNTANRKLLDSKRVSALEAVNPNGDRLEFEMHGERFFQNLRLNDAILFTQNHYDKGIQNGSLGTLTSVESSGESYGEVTLDTGDIIEDTQSVLDCMELGYAITLHKAQGSQFPRIIIAVQKGKIVDRAWLYTAITRAKAEIHIVGSSDDLRVITEATATHINETAIWLNCYAKTSKAAVD